MTVDKNIISFFLLGISSASVAAQPLNLFIEKSLSISANIGYTQFNNRTDETLKISDYVTDLLTNSKRHHSASYNFSAKQQLNIHPNAINKIMLGPSIYFQNARHTGEVWEMVSPEFYNYQYDFKSNTINFLIESDLYFKPIANHILPFVTAGVGFGVAYMHYDDYAFPGIPLDSELHRFSSQTKAVYELGAGLSLPVTPHCAVNLRYASFFSGRAETSITQYQPLSMSLNNQNVFLGINYSL